MKKLFAIFLTLALVLGMAAVPAFATEEGSITINGVSDDNVYSIYRLLDLESYDTASGAYSYKVNSEWTGFFATSEALKYVTIDESGYVTWKAAEDDDTVAAFAKAALAYAKSTGIDEVKSSENDGEFVITGDTGVFSGLELGYYLIDSTMGALCGLTTTNPDASINAKNGEPTIDKQVQEDSTGQWGAVNTADIGQTIEYRVTINVHAGAENYVLHDKMADGLTFNGVTNIQHVIPSVDTHALTLDTDYTVVTEDLADNCTFEIHFSKDFCDHLETNDKILVHYNAMLNRNAIISGGGNTNEAWLAFGEDHISTHDSVTTYTYGVDIVKTDSQNTLLDGAEFRIYDAATGGNEVAVVPLYGPNNSVIDLNTFNPETTEVTVYRRARADETGVNIVVKDGQVRVVGFDNGTYYLEEVAWPSGYNKLASRQRFIISDGNLDAVFNGDIFSTGSGVHVVNKTGSMLPETGGFGTTMLILFGGLAVMAAGIFLFVNKRMSQISE